jgi:hypothetical protein
MVTERNFAMSYTDAPSYKFHDVPKKEIIIVKEDDLQTMKEGKHVK